MQAAIKKLRGAYALVVMSRHDPDRLIATRMGCPVVVGHGVGENFVASDVQALLPVTRNFQFLEDGDVAELTRSRVRLFDIGGQPVERAVHESELSADAVELGQFKHYMQKEIFDSRVPSRIRSLNAPRTARSWMRRSAQRRLRSCRASGVFISLRAGRATTRE